MRLRTKLTLWIAGLLLLMAAAMLLALLAVSGGGHGRKHAGIRRQPLRLRAG